MAKSINKRFPHLGIILVIAIVIAIPLTVWSSNNVSTNTNQYAAGPRTTTSSIVLNPNPPAVLGNAVTFTLSYPTNTKNPWVSLICYLDQAKTQVVYGEGGTAKQASSEGFVLGGASSLWLNTPAASTYCNAELGDLYWKGGKEYYNPLASTAFTALGKQ